MGENIDCDIRNVLEIQKIQKLLINHPDLLAMMEILCIMCNERLTEHQKKLQLDLPLELNIEPNLSDHESDDD